MKKQLLFLAIVLPVSLISQRWMDLMETPNPNFNDIQTAFYEDLDENTNHRAYGVKHFKRWEHYMETRTFPTGEVKPFSKLAFEHRKNVSTRGNRSANWQPIGPKNWVNVNNGYNPGNGRINSIAVHPTNPLIIYIASAGGGVWKTVDGGTTWAPLSDDLPILESSDIIIDPNNPNTIFYASGDNDSYRSSIGIYKSIDGGANWTMSLPFGSSTKVGYLVMDPGNSNLIYCATNRGMYRSLDGGATWPKLNSTDLFNIKTHPNAPGVVYASDAGVFMRSVDSGQTFASITLPITTARRLEISTSTINPDYVYVLAAANDKGFGGVYLSKDSGLTWATMSTSPNILSYPTDGSGSGGQGTYDLSMEVNPADASEIIAGGINIWKSNDTGKTWINLTYWYLPSISSNQYSHADIHFLKYFGGKLFCGSDGGIFSSTDQGANWNNLSLPLEITEVYDFDMYKANPSILSLGAQDNGTFLNDGAGWVNINGADGFNSLISQNDPDYVIYSVQNGSFYTSFNGGLNKYGFFSDAISGESGKWQTPIDGNENLDTVLIGHKTIWFSADTGTTWDSVTAPFTSGSLYYVQMAPSNSKVVYAGDLNELSRIEIDYTTKTSTITNIVFGLPIGSAYISNITVHPTNDSVIWVTFSGSSSGNKIFETTDAGANWTNISGVLPNVSANCVAYSVFNDGLYIGTDAGVYYKDDWNAAWVAYSSGLSNALITKIIIDEVNDKVKASTYGRGIWESDGFYANTVSVNENTISDKDITVYPNPANSILNIEYKTQPNTIQLIDMIGKVVAKVNPNTNSINSVNISDLKKGVYSLVLHYNNGQIISKRVIKQ